MKENLKPLCLSRSQVFCTKIWKVCGPKDQENATNCTGGMPSKQFKQTNAMSSVLTKTNPSPSILKSLLLNYISNGRLLRYRVHYNNNKKCGLIIGNRQPAEDWQTPSAVQTGRLRAAETSGGAERAAGVALPSERLSGGLGGESKHRRL